MTVVLVQCGIATFSANSVPSTDWSRHETENEDDNGRFVGL